MQLTVAHRTAIPLTGHAGRHLAVPDGAPIRPAAERCGRCARFLELQLDPSAGLSSFHAQPDVPAIGLDPATMISYGNVASPGNSASFGHRQPDHLYVGPDEAIEYDAVVTRSAEVAAELVARLVADRRAATGLR